MSNFPKSLYTGKSSKTILSKQLLIYEKAVPLSKQTHGKWSAEVGGSFQFAQQVNSLPLTAIEFGPAAGEYPIVFTRNSEEEILPCIIVGLRGNDNLFVSEKLQWDAKYIPAFVRRYPFVFSLSDDRKTFTLCIDEAFSGFNQSGKGQKLFAKDGSPSEYVNQLMKFLQEYEVQFARTRAFCKNLDELELLEPMQAQIASPGNETTTLSGFLCVNREKVRNLSGKTLSRLASQDELELLYLHLYSLKNFQDLNERLTRRTKTTEVIAKVSK